MNLKTLLLTVVGGILISSSPLIGQDVSVTISEATINGLLTAVGPVKGKGSGKQAIKYSWTVTDAVVAFTPGASAFSAKVKVSAKGIKINEKVKGKLDISYNAETNKISMEVVGAKFPISIKLFGKRVKIATVDISKYYRPKFEFNGPEPIQSQVTMDVGGKKPRIITIVTSGHTVLLEQDALRVAVDLAYQGKTEH